MWWFVPRVVSRVVEDMITQKVQSAFQCTSWVLYFCPRAHHTLRPPSAWPVHLEPKAMRTKVPQTLDTSTKSIWWAERYHSHTWLQAMARRVHNWLAFCFRERIWVRRLSGRGCGADEEPTSTRRGCLFSTWASSLGVS